VLPGTYGVTVKLPGAAPNLRGQMVVEGDPIVQFAESTRRARQASLLVLYDVARSLGQARTAARAVTDTVGQQASRLRTDIDRQIGAVSGLARAIESYSGLPTIDQNTQVEAAFQEATRTVAELNRVIARGPMSELVRPPVRRK
jgi:hypothetical protein